MHILSWNISYAIYWDVSIRARGIVEPEVGLLGANKGVSFWGGEAFAEEALWKTKALPVHKSITFHRGGFPVSLSFAPLTLSYITRLLQFGCTSCTSRMRRRAAIIRILCVGNFVFYEFQMRFRCGRNMAFERVAALWGGLLILFRSGMN